ncbi:MAG: glycosyl hydrolase 53 family protein [Clostridia bacterium]|nr:glycosyl hydrolase 53 family protein [Clostridia bacterium]
MKKALLYLICASVAAEMMLIPACVERGPSYDVRSETLFVSKVENIPSGFIMGMDASSVISEEKSGVIYRDFDGNPADVFKVLAENGINYIRVRVWNDPYDKNGNGYGGGNCDVKTAAEIGKRAAKYGLKLLVDFHYSDFWADPSKQAAPKAWKNMDADAKADAIYDFTVSALKTVRDAGANIGMVQIGNETNGSMCGETRWAGILKLMISASKAIRKTCPKALIAVHFANPEKSDNMKDYAFRLDYYKLDYDVFGSSYYPYWHGTTDNLTDVLNFISDKYGKKVMVMETSYAFTDKDTDFWGNTIGTSGFDSKDYPFSVAGQANFVRDLTDTVVNKMSNGIGVCYWEGTWISVGTESLDKNRELWERYGSGWASSYAGEYDPEDAGKWYGGCAVENQAFFDEAGMPLESLKVFALMRTGNAAETYVDGALDCAETMMTDDRDYALPSQVTVVYSDNSKVAADVVWEPFDLAEARAKGNGKYSIKGVADGFTVFCNLSVMEFNYVSDYSFEDTASAVWKRTVNSGTLSDTHKIGATSENPLTGAYAYHFWTSDAGGVDFDVSQKLDLKTPGEYKFSFSVLGGGLGSGSVSEDAQNVFGFVSINGEIKYKVPVTVTCYSDGYRSYLLEGIRYDEGQEVEIGIHVGIAEANCWGDVDDVMFNFVR